jgi:hypothetical protein
VTLLLNRVIDEGRHLGTVLRKKVLNYLSLLQAKAVVVTSEGKGPARSGQVTSEKKKRK